MYRRLARRLCRVWIHLLVVHDGVAVDFSRQDQPHTAFSRCHCGRRMKFRKPKG